MTKPEGLDLVALLGATEAEVVVLAELHRNPRVHVVGVYDPQAEAVGHDLSEILGLRHGTGPEFLEQLASAQLVVLPRDRHRFSESIEFLRQRGCRFLEHEQALARFMVERNVAEPVRSAPPASARADAGHLEDTLQWLDRALDRETLLRSLLSIAVQAVAADKGSVQLFDPFTQQLYIAFADGLSDHTVRASRQCLGEGIAGRVAATRRAELLRGQHARDEERDRPDIQSAVCTPLVDDDELLGVLNVSTDFGSRALTPIDLELLGRVADRMAPVLRRLLQIQGLLDRSLVEDLERELDSVLAMDPPVRQGLALVRDLVQDLSGAYSASLIVLTPDGPAYQIHPGRDESGEPIATRDLDSSQGILGQVVLDTFPVVLEEKNRRAGEEFVRRDMTLYLPIGDHEPFAVLVMRFAGLSSLGHFQRSLDRVRDVLGPRLGALLSSHEGKLRHERLRRLASGLSQLVRLAPSARASEAASLFMDLTGAEAVAFWREGSTEPDSELRRTMRGMGSLDRVWERLRDRVERHGGSLRARELDPAGSELRSVLLVGRHEGPLLAALNRNPEDDLAEWGFRDEDLEAAQLLLDAAGAEVVEQDPEDESDLAPRPARPRVRPGEVPSDPALGRRILHDAVERELERAQRYHLGFSLSVFRVPVSGDDTETMQDALRDHVDRQSRASDAVLWLDPQRLAILAPEEMRGQRQLVRRIREMLENFLADRLGNDAPEIEVRSAAFPRDVSDATALLDACLGEEGEPSSQH